MDAAGTNHFALLGYAIAMSLTPGPNTLMLALSGANHGFKRTIPHIGGIVGGMIVLAGVVALGLGAAVMRFPGLTLGMKVIGAAYIGYLAWRLTFAPVEVRLEAQGERGEPSQQRAPRPPLSATEAAVFQALNPKAWMMSISCAAFLAVPIHAQALALHIGVIALALVPCTTLWTLFGVALRGLLETPRRRTAFNRTMGVLVLASGVGLFL